jgi:uncharacterized membrane protein
VIRCRRGGVAALVVVSLPVLLIVLALVVDAGTIFWARASLAAAADLAALAALQELDFEALARGQPRLVEAAAAAVARAWSLENVAARLGTRSAERLEVRVTVYNGSTDQPLPHATSGRVLTVPTVCVHLRLPVRLPVAGLIMPGLSAVAQAHADAAVVPRR